MSLHISAISIEGDARQSVEELFAACEYTIQAPAERDLSWDELHKLMKRSEDKGVAFHNDRTTIIDPELVMMTDIQPLMKISEKYGSVVTMVCEGVSATYGYSVYQDGVKVRSYMSTDGKVIEDFGDHLPEESLTGNSSLSESTVLEITSKLGFDYFELESCESFTLYHLEFAGELPVDEKKLPKGDKSPWWKLW